jgi:hypothetical protein
VEFKYANLSLEDDWETECPASDEGIHCECWYDGAECCYCGDPEMEV